MSANQLVESVAKAQFAHAFKDDGGPGDRWENLPPRVRKHWFDAARVGLEGARDHGLTDGMAEVIAKHASCCGGVAHTIWTEAIDEGLRW